MKKAPCLVLIGLLIICPEIVSLAEAQQTSTLEYEYLLELPSWGMLEWGSATLPQGFWYPTFEFVYFFNGSYFKAGKEVDYPAGGRDSASYMLTGSLQYGLTNKLTGGVYIPVVLDQKVDSGGLYATSKKVKSGVSNVGDVQLFARYRLFDRYFWGLATELGITFPTGRAYDKVSIAKESGTGDGQTDLNFAVKGDIFVSEEAFVTAGTRFVHQFKREYVDTGGRRVEEKLGNVVGLDVGFVRNFKNIGMGGTFRYARWGATEWNNVTKDPQGDIFSLVLRFSVGELKPRRHGKIGFSLDFPITGKNAPAVYRFCINIQSIFK
jgi:hypothetical protein